MNHDSPVTEIAAYRSQDHSALQAQLTIRQIMTPRRAFLCALEGEPINDAFFNVPEIYDALPVIEGSNRHDASADVVGIIDRRQVRPAQFRQSVQTHMQELSGAEVRDDMSLLDFAAQGRVDELTLVRNCDVGSIAGLVTIHDLQRLPVRIAMFAALTTLEEDIGVVLDIVASDPQTWPDLIDDPTGKLKPEITTGLKRASRHDDLGSPILAMTFGVKLALLDGLYDCGRLSQGRRPDTRVIRETRNDIAHGKPFQNIDRVAFAAKSLVELHSSIKKFIEIQS
jgi:CBS domain-containing protein